MGAPRVMPQEIVEMHRFYKELGNYAAIGEKIYRSEAQLPNMLKRKAFSKIYELRCKI